MGLQNKTSPDGKIARYKTRLVALSNQQHEGLDYTDTCAPVAKPTTVWMLFEITAAKKWEIHQTDVHNAFLHGDLHEEVYMKLPPGFEIFDLTKVCRLKTVLNILVYVDDFIVSGNDLSTMQRFKNYLSQCFHMKNLGKLKYFLGIEVVRNNEAIFISQRKHALDIIIETGLLGFKLVSTPIELNHKLLRDNSPIIENPEAYRRLVGRLIYLTFTRPEMCYIVHILSQFLKTPRQAHRDTKLGTVHYLKGSSGQGILLRADSDLRLTAYCDADWNGCF
ncbi:PREDICTED: uncharacterized protein LOC109129142 [Camelina sativa]|uniref:Uncharacterized protein LOC109129142 n=1 Tax=Camelina sativa TaxID=90675 RepID=A0ABM1QZZ2_CAMSA|nr:PREDICTED: uncharacterized protein LOC109129142 [Camelina sativa]